MDLIIVFAIFIKFPIIFGDITNDWSSAIDPLDTEHYQHIVVQKTAQNESSLYRDGRIVGGTPAALGQFDYHVLLYAERKSVLCGGSLIKYNWVLTAAHCVFDMKDFEVHLGTINRSKQPTRIFIIPDNTHVKIHENFDDWELLNDIALIYLAEATEPLLNSPYIGVLNLPESSDILPDLTNQNGTICGFGKTSDYSGASTTLNFITIPIMSNMKCSQYFQIDKTNVCVDTQSGKSPCNGDSGGALFIETSDGSQSIVGVLSFGDISCTRKHPVAFTRVTEYLSWIRNKMDNLDVETTTNGQTTTTSGATTTNEAEWLSYPKSFHIFVTFVNLIFMVVDL